MRSATINLRGPKESFIQMCSLRLINLKVTKVEMNGTNTPSALQTNVKPYKFREGWQVIELWSYSEHADVCVAYIRINPHTGKYECCSNTVMGLPDVNVTIEFGAGSEKMNHEYVEVPNVVGAFKPFQDREIERIIPIEVIFPVLKGRRHELRHKFNPHGSLPLSEIHNIVNIDVDGMSPWSQVYSTVTGEVIVHKNLNELPNTAIRYLVIYK